MNYVAQGFVKLISCSIVDVSFLNIECAIFKFPSFLLKKLKRLDLRVGQFDANEGRIENEI